GDQGLRHRLGRPGGAGAVRGLYVGPAIFLGQSVRLSLLRRHGDGRFRPDQPLCGRGPAVRGAVALPVRRHVDDGGGPRGRIGGGR
ncbi:hypothetical protein LTR94_036746, partial [Friedmanniomyces endolithicus]